MSNRDIDAARRCHDATKHSVARLHATPHGLQWEIQPLPFKIYSEVDPVVRLEAQFRDAVPAFAALSGSLAPSAEASIEIGALARILALSCGVTKRQTYPGGYEHSFRAAACTGALYHVDAYVVCADLPGLEAGVYHFGPHDSGLRPLRRGDYRAFLAQVSGGEPSVSSAPANLIFASTYWRNAWKYRARAYRHCFWDCGTILANALAAANAEGLPASVVTGFVDSSVHRLLGLDDEREGALAVLTLGHEHGKPPGPVASVPTLQLKTAPLSSREIDYPEIRAAHEASRLDAPAEVRDWRAAAADAAHAALATSGESHPLRPLAAGGLPNEPLDSVIRRRGSTRRFSHRPIRFEELSTLLRVAAGALRSDFGDSPNLMYLIVNAVDGLRPGAYVYHSRAEEMEMLRDGDFRREAGFLGLGQALPADASVALFFCCDLDPVLRRLGNRGYRVAQLDAAVRGGRLYLASYALGLGATGLTFFDDDVIEFFSPHANGKSVMFLIAVGHRAAPRRPR